MWVCVQFGLELSEAEWSSEWQTIVKLSSPHPRSVDVNPSVNRFYSLTLDTQSACCYLSVCLSVTLVDKIGSHTYVCPLLLTVVHLLHING